jgi:NitT/TauT family transport system permease protein
MTSQDNSAHSSSSAPLELRRQRMSMNWKQALTSPRARSIILPTITFIAILAIWEGASRGLSIPSFVLPSPSRIVMGFEAITFSRWMEHVWATLRVALIGYFLSIAFAIPVAIGLTRSKTLADCLYPILVVVQSTPIVAVAPIIIVVLGSQDAPRIVITFLITFFPLVVSTTTGLMATPPELIELSRSLRAPVSREFTQIRIPFAIPYIFSALKISITLAVIGAVVAEFVAADKGVGYFIQFSTSLFKLPEAWAGLGVLVLMSLALFQLVELAQRVFFPWSLPKEAT